MTNSFLTGQGDNRIHLQATMNFATDTWDLYTYGYLEAAKALVEGLDSGSISDSKIDLLVYPVAFLYRHHIELRIKQLYLKVCDYLSIQPKLRTDHTLIKNWEDFKTELEKAVKNTGIEQQTQDHIRNVETKLVAFLQLDNTSMTFRYPVDKNGNNLLANQSYLHLGQLRDFVTDLANDLHYIDMEISTWM